MATWAKFKRRIMAAGGMRLGTTANHTDISTAGRITMTGTGRVRKDLWIPAKEFWNVESGCIAGSMAATSALINVTGSIFAGVSTSMASIPVVAQATDVSTSATTTFATFPVPRDKDTTGSIAATIEWTATCALATTGCTVWWKVGLGYLASGAAVRTAASTGACAAYVGTAAGIWFSTALGNLPSFGANDTVGVLIVRRDQTEGDDASGSMIGFTGVKLTYTACALGTASAE